MKPSKATKLHNIVINPIIGVKMISIMGFFCAKLIIVFEKICVVILRQIFMQIM